MSYQPVAGQILAAPSLTPPSGNFEGFTASGTVVISTTSNTVIEGSFQATSISDGVATLTGGKLSNLVTPTNNGDAANKAYVDSQISTPSSWKTSVKAATTTNITLSGPQTIDFVTIATGDRVLVKNQTNGIENGIYDANSTGNWTRSSDMAAGTGASASAVIVQNGLVNKDIGFLCTNNSGLDIVGSASLDFQSFTGNSVQAGDGLQRVGDVISVDSTVLRTTGDQSKSGTLSITDTTQSTSFTTGCLVLSGGLGIAKDVTAQNKISSNCLTVTNQIIGGSLTDGVTLIDNGNITGVINITATTLTDGSIVLTGGNITGLTNLTASGTLTANTFTDGTITMTGGGITTTGNITANTFANTGTSLTISGGNISGAGLLGGATAIVSGTVLAAAISDQTATMQSGQIINLVNPTEPSNAATKAYVDSFAQGVFWKEPVRVATTTNITLAGIQTIDGILLVAGNRILVKNQTNAVENGIYLAAAGAWSRSTDMAVGTSASGAAMTVEEGTTNQNTGYTCTNSPGSGVVGTNDLTFIKFITLETIIAGNGLVRTVNTLSVDVDNVTIEIVSNKLQVKTMGIGTNQLANGSVTDIKIPGPIDSTKLNNSSITLNNGSGITGGGTVQLGNSLTLAVDSTVLRTTGNQIRTTGTLTFNDNTQSTSTTTGSIVTAGGIGLSGNIFAGGNISVTGSITGGSITDGVATLTGGNLSLVGNIGCVNVTASGTVSGNILTGTSGTITTLTATTITATSITGLSALTVTGTLQGASITDGVATMSSGNLTGLNAFSAATLTASGGIIGATVTTGTTVLSDGSLTNLNTPTASGDAANKAYVDAIDKGVTSISAGTGITMTPNPIIATGTVALSDSGVTGGVYGKSDAVGQFTVDSKGRITNATEVAIQDASAVQSGFVNTSAQTIGGLKTFANGISTTLVTGLAVPANSTEAANKQYVDSQFPDYSTSEMQLPEKWIGGQTIYRKVVNMGSLPGVIGIVSVAHGISPTPVHWVNIRVMATNGTRTYFTPDAYSEVWADNTNINFDAITVGWSGYTGTAIVEYTKT